MKRFSLLILLICVVVKTDAQAYRAFARRYGLEEGLPHRQVNKIIQDRRGFIWAATNAGLARFDGRQFKVFNKTESGLAGDLVEWVAEDANGYIWASRSGPNGWLCVLEPVSGTVIPPEIYFKKHPLPAPVSRWWKAPVKMADGSLLISLLEPGGLLRYHPEKGWSVIKLPDCNGFLILKSSIRQTVWGLYLGPDTSAPLVEIDGQGKILNRIMPKPGGAFREKKGATMHPDHFFLLETAPAHEPAVWEIDGEGRRRPAACFPEYIYTPQQSRLENDRIEVQFPLILDQSGRVLLDIGRQYPEIDPTQYRDYLLDHNGNVWFATTFGLIVVDIRKNYFRRLLYDENAPGGRGKACRGLLEKNGRLLVNLETHGQGRFRVNPQTGDAERLSGICGIGIAASADGYVWTECVVTPEAWRTLSLFKAAPDGQLTGHHLLRNRDFGYIWTILEENPRRVLLGHSNGITVYDPIAGTAEPWHDEQFPQFDRANVSWLAKDRLGQIWACTEQGLFQLKSGGGIAARYWSGGAGAAYLPYDHICHFYEDREGIFWLGTAGGGLIRWDRKAPPGQHARVIYRQNGLLNGMVYATYEDRRGHLWLPTDYGIVQLDKKSLQVRHTWLTADGLTHHEFNRVSHCQGADGTLYFGGLNGVTAFNPDDFYENNTPGKAGLPLVISAFSVFDPARGRLENRTPDLLRANRITIHPDDRYVQLEFALLEYFAPEKVTYTWKLEGVASAWETLKEPVLRLSGLPFGTHRLRIRAQAADGTMATNELDIGLRVLPPVYLRGWFLTVAALLLVAGIWAWLRWRTRAHRREQERLEAEVNRQTATIRRQTEELKRLDEAKSRFFANVSHELRTPLTLILGPLSSILKGNRLDSRDTSLARTAQAHAKQLLQLVNEILDLSKMESGKMKLRETTVSLQPFLRRLVSAFESHAERLGILFLFEYRLPERLRVLADEDKLQKVLNNLLSNALKFTPLHAGGSVSVRVEDVDGYIRIGVHDTGRGIHPDDLPRVFERFYQTAQSGAPVEGGTGIGLALCREFADVMQGRIRVESALGQGSHFYFEFPKKEVLGVNNDELLMMNDELSMMNDESGPTSEGPIDSSFIIHHSSLNKTILLVEDNESMRDFVRHILSGKYKLLTAENGNAALKILDDLMAAKKQPADTGVPPSTLPDLILSDVMMPAMDGFQLLEALKSDDRWRHIPVVMLTARADMRDKLRALRTGVDDYLLKPFEEEELLARVENLLKNYDGRRAEGGDAPAEERPPATVTAEDLAWLEQLEKLTETNVGDSRLSTDWLAYSLFTGRNLFYKKVKRLTGMTPNEYIQDVRMNSARRLLETGACQSVKEASFRVGLRDVKYFSEQFKKRFGKLPSEYR